MSWPPAIPGTSKRLDREVRDLASLRHGVLGKILDPPPSVRTKHCVYSCILCISFSAFNDGRILTVPTQSFSVLLVSLKT